MPLISSGRKKRSRTSSDTRRNWFLSNKKITKSGDVAPERVFSFDRESGFYVPEQANDGPLVKDNLKTRLRRGSSRLFSIFRSLSNGSKAVTMSSTSDPRRDAVNGVANPAFGSPRHGPISEDIMTSALAQNSSPAPSSAKAKSLGSRASGRTLDEMDLVELETDGRRNNRLGRSKSSTSVRRKQSDSLRRSQSTPGLTHRLSHRLSSTFGQPTIVHRTSLRSRPSVRSIHEIAQAVDPAAHMEMEHDSTEPSSHNSTNASSPQRASTDPTTYSRSSSGPNRSPTERAKSLILERPNLCLAPIAEHSTLDFPTIVTVEATAVAKIFFETHFNSIFFDVKPRSQRRQNLEDQLYSVNLSLEAKNKIRETWARQETEWLRQERVLKSRTNGSKGIRGVSIGGYDVVKVLGKGSFGVVRLVKETKQKGSGEATPSPSSSPSRRLSMADLAQLRAVAKQWIPRRKDVKVKKEVYAMKVIRKADMLRNAQEGHLRAERDLLVASSNQNSRWIVPLIASFQDYKYLYLVMDYCVGGDFLGLLIRKNTLSEEVTKWYIAEMILCVEEAHKMRWIHRDVKPDNFLITASGHLKISDFGLAFDGEWAHDQSYYNNHRSSLMDRLGIKLEGDEQDKNEAQTLEASRRLAKAVMGPDGSDNMTVDGPNEGEKVLNWRNKMQRRDLAKSVVGTSQYMAPEVIRGEFYDGRCDWWSIGIILYECLFGFTPFACENRQETKMKILRHRTTLAFPAEQAAISNNAIDLILSLLQEKDRRLCSRKYTLNDYYQRSQTSHGEGSHLGRAKLCMPADKSHRDYLGYFVYPDDADELKSHRFFSGIRWSELHLLKPPFVPRVKNWEDTKYFDEDEPISDIASDSETEVEGYIPSKDHGSPTNPGSHHPENQHIIPSAPIGKDGRDPTPEETNKHKSKMAKAANNKRSQLLQRDLMLLKAQADGAAGFSFGQSHLLGNPLQCPTLASSVHKAQLLTPPTSPTRTTTKTSPITAFGKTIAPLCNPSPPKERQCQEAATPASPSKKKKAVEKKRPRDIALRDPTTAKAVMEIRKRGAFLGYDWKRQQYHPQLDDGINHGSGSGSNRQDMLGRVLQELVNEEGSGSTRLKGRRIADGDENT